MIEETLFLTSIERVDKLYDKLIKDNTLSKEYKQRLHNVISTGERIMDEICYIRCVEPELIKLLRYDYVNITVPNMCDYFETNRYGDYLYDGYDFIYSDIEPLVLKTWNKVVKEIEKWNYKLDL